MNWAKQVLLKFDDEAHESQFCSEYSAANNSNLSVILPLLSLILTLFLIGFLVAGLDWNYPLVRMYSIAIVLTLMGAYLSRAFNSIVAYNQGICTFFACALIVGISVAHISAFEELRNLDSHLIVLMVSVALLRLRVKYSIILTAVIWMTFISSWVFFSSNLLLRQIIPLFIFAGSCIFVLALSYILERQRRLTFMGKIFVEAEKSLSNSLLDAVVPHQIKDSLQNIDAKKHFNASDCLVVFIEVKRLSTDKVTRQSLEELDKVFRKFDEIIIRYRFETIKTFGNEYILAGGVFPDQPIDYGNARTALTELIEVTRDFGLSYRMGADIGPVVAGVIGIDALAFDIWGKTVNTAARLKQGAGWESVLTTKKMALKIGYHSSISEFGLFKGVGQVEVVKFSGNQQMRKQA